MSNIPKITIEKRILKVGNNENFILEYPSNYEEVVSRKLNNLQKEYDETVSNNKTNNNTNDIKKQKEINDGEKNEKKENEEENNKKAEKKEENDFNTKNINNNYYQPIGGVETFMNDDNDDDIKDNLNNNIEKKPDIHLEPQEGFIEIKNKKIEIEKENKIDNNKNDEKEKNEEKYEEKEEKEEDEFYEVEEKENGEHNNENIKSNKEEIRDEKKVNKRSSSPVNDPESIKLSMKSLNFKTPIWAENLSDKDFINMAKNIISSKKKNP